MKEEAAYHCLLCLFQSVSVFHTELTDAFFKGRHRQIICMIVVVQFGRNEEFFSGNAALADTESYASFVMVCLCCIDMMVSGFDRTSDGICGDLAIRRLPGTESDAGDLYIVGKCIAV